MRNCLTAASWRGGWGWLRSASSRGPCRWPDALAGSSVAVCTVIGFPHGADDTRVKAFAARTACESGATELDMVVNVGKVLSRDWAYVAADIRAVVEVAHARTALAKVIFENELLPDDALKIELCHICSEAGADFVKTSTGFGFIPRRGGGFHTIGATDADLILMRKHAAPHVKLKASGGVRTYDDALRVREARRGAIGTSSTEAIAAGQQSGVSAVPSQSSY